MAPRKPVKHPTAPSIEDLRAMGAFPDATGGRGRPKHDHLGDLNRLSIEAAAEVQQAKEADPRAYGAITRGVKRVAGRLNQTEAWVRKSWQRQPIGQELGSLQHHQQVMKSEIERRMRVLPADVIAILHQLPANELLSLLREEGVDSTNPSEFVEKVRRPDFLSQS
ncbi:MAG: hypothetical protein KIT86_07025 [Hydrogenophaga sp.]|uniref:hypothetical protein n=1 Tax=Hydrogenophaga sp. TaxID=1904254 RepID=UPI002614FB70|nr:hypothetical protein [Hydrogenophaga sp.]MCW5669397.1 hypothetical protein [Hydrogenophaga sp.]